jgi:hypothetical protein
MKMRAMILASMIVAFPAQAVTPQTKPVTCLTKPELRAGLAFAMQEMMVTVGSKCSPLLPESSYLRTKGSQLVARYADTASNSNEILNGLVKRLGPDLKIADGDPIAMKGLASTMIATGLGKFLTDKNCLDVDKTLSLLDPLPPENMIGLIEFAIQKVDASERAKGKPASASKRPILCTAGEAETTSLNRH